MKLKKANLILVLLIVFGVFFSAIAMSASALATEEGYDEDGNVIERAGTGIVYESHVIVICSGEEVLLTYYRYSMGFLAWCCRN